MSRATSMSHKTFQERGYCTRGGYKRLDAVLAELCRLGNAALQERRDAWKMARKPIRYQDQCKSLTLVRHDDPEGPVGKLHVAAARGALQRVDRAYQAFFRRCKSGKKPGYPRFRRRSRYTTIEINDVTKSQVREHPTCTLVKVKGLPTIKLRPHRPLPATKPRAIRIVRRACGCTVDLVYEHEPTTLKATDAHIGADLGCRQRVFLSNGESFKAEREDSKPIRRAQRAIARCKRRSKRRQKRVRQLARLRRRQQVRSRNACHRITSSLVARFGVISIEDLKVRNMTASARGTAEEPGRCVRAKAGLNRAIQQQSWGRIREQLSYKAAWAGRELVAVNPQYTSQDCSVCKHRRSKPDGAEWWTCERCRTRHQRDHNAATNIDRAGILALGSQSRTPGSCSSRKYSSAPTTGAGQPSM